MIKLTECPRDAMQGWPTPIPTDVKIEYLNQLLKVGFDIIDLGSFVSPRLIPQLKDTPEVLNKLDLSSTKSKLLAIIANQRGAEDACQFEEISFLGFPYSISETFQKLNTNSTILESLKRVEKIQELCIQHNKKMVVYISMAFGNPYGDECNLDILHQSIENLNQLGIEIMPLSDILGNAKPETIGKTFQSIIPTFSNIEFGLHLHTREVDYYDKVDLAYQAGCRKFDVVMNGYGGCPRTGKGLVGNLNTMDFINYLNKNNISISLNKDELIKAQILAQKVFL
jgi:hydroxymethylglutaryl-CoA lyase